jgi:hypothetical protein
VAEPPRATLHRDSPRGRAWQTLASRMGAADAAASARRGEASRRHAPRRGRGAAGGMQRASAAAPSRACWCRVALLLLKRQRPSGPMSTAHAAPATMHGRTDITHGAYAPQSVMSGRCRRRKAHLISHPPPPARAQAAGAPTPHSRSSLRSGAAAPRSAKRPLGRLCSSDRGSTRLWARSGNKGLRKGLLLRT